jgi:hypothetical protein
LEGVLNLGGTGSQTERRAFLAQLGPERAPDIFRHFLGEVRWVRRRLPELAPFVRGPSPVSFEVHRDASYIELAVGVLGSFAWLHLDGLAWAVYELKGPFVAIDPEEPAEDTVGSDCYVTLQQAAAMVSKTKRGLEDRKGDMPSPDIKGGGGRASEWKWSTIRPWLERTFSRPLPEQFPADQFIRR